MHFEFATAAHILFGPGTSSKIAAPARSMGARAFVVTGRDPERAQRIRADLISNHIDAIPFQVLREPTTDLVTMGAAAARNSHCDFVIGIGGGSVLDAAKAIAAFMTNPGDPLEYLEVVGQGKPLGNPPAPWIAVPTTAGTGAEVTKNSVLASESHQVKVSLRSPLLYARMAVVDPQLTLGLPPSMTASTGLDALTQLIEPYVSIRANPLTDAFCVEGLRCCARSLRRCFENGSDLAAREDLSFASLLSGLALANAGLGAVHGFASPIGGAFTAPHGAVCAALLPHVIDVNIRALRQREPENRILRRFDEVARLLTGKPQATSAEGALWVRDLCERFEIPKLRSYGIRSTDLPALVEKSSRASSMKTNPIQLTGNELREILAGAV
ncbi:MAG: iron-containing alcohol dehydrogenase [Verrucomicrobia bacterium]|nr:iron-containing alcohol dehydrogenase [Verrucomicrobiota bacterium]